MHLVLSFFSFFIFYGFPSSPFHLFQSIFSFSIFSSFSILLYLSSLSFRPLLCQLLHYFFFFIVPLFLHLPFRPNFLFLFFSSYSFLHFYLIFSYHFHSFLPHFPLLLCQTLALHLFPVRCSSTVSPESTYIIIARVNTSTIPLMPCGVQ